MYLRSSSASPLVHTVSVSVQLSKSWQCLCTNSGLTPIKDALLTSYDSSVALPPFRAAILEYPYQGSLYECTNSTASWLALAAALNCSSKDSYLTCVRAAPATTIQSIIEESILAFNPVSDNVTLVASPAAARARGAFAKVRVLGGTNANEGRILEFGSSNVTALLDEFFGLLDPSVIPALTAAFPVGNITGYNTGYDQVSAIEGYWVFQCGQALWANETAAQGVPTWRYYFNASFPNKNYFPDSGVYHSSEIRLVWQTYYGGPVAPNTPGPLGLVPANVPPTAQEAALGQYMNGAWAAFARDPQHGPGWNRFGTFDGTDLGVLGANGSAGVTVIRQSEVDSVCQLFIPAYRALLGDKYGLGGPNTNTLSGGTYANATSKRVNW